MYDQQRMHPIAVLDYLFRSIKNFIEILLPLLIIMYGKFNILLVALAVAVIFVVYAILYWYRYVFYVYDDEFRLEYGVMVRKKRYVPLERIQSVEISAGLLQRMFGLVKLQVETAGGERDAEISLAALSVHQAEELRQILKSRYGSAGNEAENKEIIKYQLSGKELLIVGSTSNGIGVMLSGLLVLFSQIEDIFPSLNIYDRLAGYAQGVVSSGITIVILTAIFLVFLAWIASLLGTVISMGNFMMIRHQDNIYISRGLIEKKEVTLPLKRIQAVKITEGILRQPFGLASIEVISAGYGGEKGELSTIYPLVPIRSVNKFLHEVLPEFDADLEVHALPSRARVRYLMSWGIPIVLCALGLEIFFYWGCYLLLLLPAGLLMGLSQYRNAGIKVDSEKLITRIRIIGRITTILPRKRIQSLDIATSFWQKRAGIATLTAAHASSAGGAAVKISGVDDGEAAEIMAWFRAKLQFPSA